MENKIIELANALIDEIEKQGLDLYDEKQPNHGLVNIWIPKNGTVSVENCIGRPPWRIEGDRT